MARLKGLSQKQERFVDEYLIDLNATQAAIRAGYSKNNADKVGSRLVGNSRVSKTIQAAKIKRAIRTGLMADYVLQGLMEVATRCMEGRPVLNMSGKQVYDENNARLWKIDSAGANKALELLGKHLGLFNSDAQGSQNVTPVQIEAIRKIILE